MRPISGGRKRCNRLDGKTWTRYSISVWNDLKKSAAEARLNHPAAFPEMLAQRCIEIFTGGPGEIVLDPFAGSGTTLIGARNLGRQGIGLELYEHYLTLFKERLLAEGQALDGSAVPEPRFILGDARRLEEYIAPQSVDFVLTSPPYWNILKARRSADHRESRFYGDHPADLGLTENYASFIRELQAVFSRVRNVIKPGCHCVVAVMDLRKKDLFFPLHMDLCAAFSEIGFTLDDIIIWDRRAEYNRLRPLGYPSVFRVNKIHEYLLIFRAQ
ncbi:MAG: site-specific DNA-methyltransferase [Bacillota bacterium]